MCIILLSTAHPSYPYIIAANRDEYLARPTAPATWWTDHPSVLAGRDLARPEKGTWLGVTSSGRIAALTNVRETSVEVPERSRGEVVREFLTHEDTEDEHGHVHDKQGRSGRVNKSKLGRATEWLLKSELDTVGGFSMLFGYLRAPSSDGSRQPLAIISNRSKGQEVLYLARLTGQTHGLSNALFSDISWPKIGLGTRSLGDAVNAEWSKDELLDRIFDVLSTDTMVRAPQGADLETQLEGLKGSIFVPRVEIGEAVPPLDAAEATGRLREGEERGNYGTMKQTVVLVDRAGRVTFVERTLYDQNGIALGVDDNDYEARVEFDIEGWLDAD